MVNISKALGASRSIKLKHGWNKIPCSCNGQGVMSTPTDGSKGKLQSCWKCGDTGEEEIYIVPKRFPPVQIMSKEDSLFQESTDPSFHKKLDKTKLVKKTKMCSHCPPNKGENAKRKPTHPSWKKLRKNKFKRVKGI